MIITGTGDVFMDQIEGPSLGDISKLAHCDILWVPNIPSPYAA
jgi:hypothetical protein